MTVSAELYIEHAEPLPLVGEGLPWIRADAVPALRVARQEAMRVGQQLLDERTELLRAGEYEQVPYAVDPLTTAGRYVEAECRYGPEHPVTLDALESTVADSRRLLGEAGRTLTWEYWDELEQTHDTETEHYYFLDRSQTEMVDQGITPIAETEQTFGRLDEKVEEATYGAIRTLGHLALENVVIMNPAQPITEDSPTERAQDVMEIRSITVTECDDWAIEAYKNGTETNFGGLVPEIEKFMIRGVRFSKTKDSRYMENLALSGKNIIHEDIVEGMKQLKAIPPGSKPTKQEVRATQMLNVNGQGVIAFAELLDEISSRRTGLRIFMGEVIPDDQPKDYSQIAAMAAEREKALDQDAKVLANYLIELESKGVDHWYANGLVLAFVKKQLLGKVRNDPEQAAVIFGDETAQGIAEVMELRERGQMEAAWELEQRVEAAAPPPVFCGADSCGLTGVNESSPEGAAGRKLGLQGEMLSFAKGRCPNPDCAKLGGLMFDLKGNKACTACGSAEINGHVYGAMAKKQSLADAILKAAQKTNKQSNKKSTKKKPAVPQKV